MPEPNVFISYSHDSALHKEWVLRLATDLRTNGVDAKLDVWELVLGQDVAAFMQRGIAEADRVLLVCTEAYVRKAEEGKGGVGYERLIVTGEVVQAIETKKFIPVMRSNAKKSVRGFLGPRMYIDFTDDGEYAKKLDELLRELHGMPAAVKPPLGSNPFSAQAAPPLPRAATPTGVNTAGELLLDDKWFEEQRVVAERGIQGIGLTGLMELRFALHDPLSKSQLDLLNAVSRSQIKTFGWPIGVVIDTRDEFRPRPVADGIRAELSIPKDPLMGHKSYDYWAARRNGDFFLLQSLFEDMRAQDAIFFNTRIVRVTESLLFASNLYTNLGVPPEERLSVRVAHRGLAQRTLSAVGNRFVALPRKTIEPASESEVVAEVGKIREKLVPYVRQLLDPLFMLFEFQQFDEAVYTDIVRRFERGEST
jgi:hypothetical protein